MCLLRDQSRYMSVYLCHPFAYHWKLTRGKCPRTGVGPVSHPGRIWRNQQPMKWQITPNELKSTSFGVIVK